MPKRVKVLENIPTQKDLQSLIELYKADGAQVGWSQQPDGRYRMEAVLQDTAKQETTRSLVSGIDLNPA